MSDDLVQRLRQCSHTCFDERDDHVNPKDTLYWEAADRIEALEAALRGIADCQGTTWIALRDHARRALEDKS